MLPYVDAFVPCFGMLALGAVLKRRLLRDDAIWAGIEKLIFWVLLPSLLVAAIGSVRLGEVPILGMLVAIWVALGLGTLLSLLISRHYRQPHAAMTSVVMGGIRFNNLIGFAVAGAKLTSATSTSWSAGPTTGAGVHVAPAALSLVFASV